MGRSRPSAGGTKSDACVPVVLTFKITGAVPAVTRNSVEGKKAHEVSAGRFPHENLRVPVNPLSDVASRLKLAVWPARTVADVALAASE